MDRIGVEELVLAGTSGSRRDQPIEFKESRKDVEAIFARVPESAGSRLSLASLYGAQVSWVQYSVCMIEATAGLLPALGVRIDLYHLPQRSVRVDNAPHVAPKESGVRGEDGR